MQGYCKAVHGMQEYDELIEVEANSVDRAHAAEGWAVIDIRALSASDSAYVSLTLEQAKQHMENVRQAIEFLENS